MRNIINTSFLLFAAFVAQAQSNLYPVQIKGKWGYTTVQGKLAIAAEYDYAETFYEGYAVVALNNQPCVINLNNQRVIDTGLYTNIQRFSQGLSKVTNLKQEQFFVNTKGQMVFKLAPDYYDARPFKHGLSSVAKKVDIHVTKFGADIVNPGYKFGFMNTTGQEVIACNLDDVDEFTDGYARFREGTTFGVLDTLGNVVVKPIYNNLGKFFEGLAVADAGGRYGFIDAAGTMVIKPTFEYAYDFSEGLAGVRLNGKYGYIDNTGKLVIAATYDAIRPFSEGLAAVKQNGKWGFIDTKGTLKLRFVFDDATLFVNDRCPVLVKRKWGFIDSRGALVIPAEFDAVGTFNDGLAEVMRGQISVYVNKMGDIIPILK